MEKNKNISSEEKEKKSFNLKKLVLDIKKNIPQISKKNIVRLFFSTIIVFLLVLSWDFWMFVVNIVYLFLKQNAVFILMLVLQVVAFVLIILNWGRVGKKAWRMKNAAVLCTFFVSLYFVIFGSVVTLSGVQRQNLIDSVRIAMITDTSTTNQPNKLLVEMEKLSKEMPKFRNALAVETKKITTYAPTTVEAQSQQTAPVSETKEVVQTEKTPSTNRVKKGGTLNKQKKQTSCKKPLPARSLNNYTFTKDGRIIPG